MNGRCQSCDLEQECGYPYKPTECCNYRKFRPIAEQAPRAEEDPSKPRVVHLRARSLNQQEQES